MANTIQIAIFAKAPIAGFAKTRLIPRLGACGAARLQHQLISRTLHTAQAARLGPITLWCAPTSRHPLFQLLATQEDVALQIQPQGDLGRRMEHVFALGTAILPTLLVGTDCPALTPHHLVRCAQALEDGADAVFIPVVDGGYSLIGLARPAPCLFRNIAWGSAEVMAATRARACAAGLRWHELPPLFDLDVTEDYERALALGLVAQDDGTAQIHLQCGGTVS